MKKKLQIWNKEVFGQFGQKVRQAEDKVLDMENLFDKDPTVSNRIQLCKIKTELDARLRI